VSEETPEIDVPENGPFLVKGTVTYTDAIGNEKAVVALQRTSPSVMGHIRRSALAGRRNARKRIRLENMRARN